MIKFYLNEVNAIKEGYTHHGRYYRIPVWLELGDDKDDFAMAAKWLPMEIAITIMHHIEGLITSIFYPGDEPMFKVAVGPKIGDHR